MRSDDTAPASKDSEAVLPGGSMGRKRYPLWRKDQLENDLTSLAVFNWREETTGALFLIRFYWRKFTSKRKKNMLT